MLGIMIIGIAVAISFFASAPPQPPVVELWMGHNAFNAIGLEHKPVPILVGHSGNYLGMGTDLQGNKLTSFGLTCLVLSSKYGESFYLSMNFLPELIWHHELPNSVTMPIWLEGDLKWSPIYSDTWRMIEAILTEDSFKNSVHLGNNVIITHQIYSFNQTIIMQNILWSYPEDYNSLKELFNTCIEDNRISQYSVHDIQTFANKAERASKPLWRRMWW